MLLQKWAELIPLVQLTGCEVEGNSRPSLRVSLAGHFEVFRSFTLSPLFGVSVEHVALAFTTHKAFPCSSLKLLVAFRLVSEGRNPREETERTYQLTALLLMLKGSKRSHSQGVT